ncbi:hypothetical protein TX23_15435 [Pseudomonas paralactis]|uniref:Phospholipase D-like domain-containing protein n=1 Tax=Pseudomonas paralactis TaxID=1615673 RepID=A0A0R3AHJ8_9PSED|nr:hypothetical protein [Pseudomonas paralactis]KRP71660.1 hypothetical protein TX23_15435 [Pseudomonas paralactis]
MSFDLLSVPEGYQLDLALVIAPYVDVKFMDALVKRMNPRRLCLLVDDGVRPEDLQGLHKARRKGVKLQVRLGRTAGLMHMKAFYFEFIRKEAPKRRKRRLLFGSANATNAAFLGHRNAELFANLDLAIQHDADIADYFSRILATFDTEFTTVIEGAEVWPSQIPKLYLPRFKSIVPGAMPFGFDTWLQRGLLAAQYRNAPQFAILNIQLKKVLPQEMVAKIFASRNFTEKGDRDIVRYGYMNGSSDIAMDGTEMPRWKSRYGVWTHLGDWISYECYKSHSTRMKSKASSARHAKISKLLGSAHDAGWRREKIDALLRALAEVWSDLEASEVVPNLYLESKNGKLNSTFYEQRLIQKLEQDIHLAQDEDFKKRYVNGYDFPDVPRFRQDVIAWERFVYSWCESIAVEAVKKLTPSLVARRIRYVMEREGLNLFDLEPKEIGGFLRANWEKEWEDYDMTVGEWIIAYHEQN